MTSSKQYNVSIEVDVVSPDQVYRAAHKRMVNHFGFSASEASDILSRGPGSDETVSMGTALSMLIDLGEHDGFQVEGTDCEVI